MIDWVVTVTDNTPIFELPEWANYEYIEEAYIIDQQDCESPSWICNCMYHSIMCFHNWANRISFLLN